MCGIAVEWIGKAGEKNSLESVIKSSVLGKLNLRVSPSEDVK